MNTISKLEFPEKIKRIEYNPDFDYGKIFKFELDSIAINEFIVKNKLKPIKSIKDKLILIDEIELRWFENNHENIEEKEFLFITDCTPHNIWNVLVRKKTGEIWYEVLHSDNGGDLPKCD
ncbi:hypothetical protein [Aureivirga sp. CE67]|uniref:hypothetical protein n=1 Tax=Aureivirga sp. CE67 TaxID=1788983 RepID=UPI0018CB4D43|nr:hypothetical protein [Aureivirga sp. CE67]